MYSSGAGTGPGRVRGNANLQDCLASPSRRSIPSPHECNAHLTSRILHAPATLLSDMGNLYFSCLRNSFRQQVPGHNSAIRALETLPINVECGQKYTHLTAIRHAQGDPSVLQTMDAVIDQGAQPHAPLTFKLTYSMQPSRYHPSMLSSQWYFKYRTYIRLFRCQQQPLVSVPAHTRPCYSRVALPQLASLQPASQQS
jgi:hypothetical protein